MYNEKCKHCSQVESAHLWLAELLVKQLHDEKLTDEVIDGQFDGNPRPCEKYESVVEHKIGCPVFVDDPEDVRMDLYCQHLPGGCDDLIEFNLTGVRNWQK